MKRKVVFYIILVLFVFTLVLSMKISYARYKIHLESNPITINTRAYADLIIDTISLVDGEEDMYNVTVSNTNDYDVNFNVLAINQNETSEKLNVIQYSDENNVVQDYTVSAGNSITIKVKVEKNAEIANYTTTQIENNSIIPISISVKGTSPYNANEIIQTTEFALKVENTRVFGDTITSANYGDLVEYDVTIKDCAQVPKETDGAVTLGKGDNGELDNWKVFLKEGNRVWLIYGDYLPAECINVSNTGMLTDGDYSVSWDVSKFDSNNNYNNQAVNTLTNSENWSYLISNELKTKCTDAIAYGSPSLIQWRDSWNSNVLEENKLNLKYDDTTQGYNIVKGDSDETAQSITVPNSNILYFPAGHDIGNVSGYWLANSFGGDTEFIACINNDVVGFDNISNKGFAIRPIISIESSILEQEAEGVWKLNLNN